MKIVDLFTYPTISALVGHLSPAPAAEPSSADPREEARQEQAARPEAEGIAIIGDPFRTRRNGNGLIS